MPLWVLLLVLSNTCSHTLPQATTIIQTERQREEVRELRLRHGEGAVSEFKERLRTL